MPDGSRAAWLNVTRSMDWEGATLWLAAWYRKNDEEKHRKRHRKDLARLGKALTEAAGDGADVIELHTIGQAIEIVQPSTSAQWHKLARSFGSERLPVRAKVRELFGKVKERRLQVAKEKST